MQHVGLVHPETGDSPFVVEDEGQKRRSMDSVREGARSRGATSGDGYIECECGETVLLSDFSSHSDLHLAEGMAFEEAEKAGLNSDTTILSREQSYHSDADTLASKRSTDASSYSTDHSSLGSNPRSRSRGAVHKHPYSIKDWANVLLGSSPPPRSKTTKARRKSTKRLGVGLIDIIYLGSDTDYMTESRSRSACVRRADAKLASETTGTGR